MTDEQKNTPSGTEQREENVDLYALFFKYFAYWPWFVASVLVCIISAFIYLRYQAPVYNVDAAVLIKEGDKKGGSSNNPMGALQDLGMFSMTNNFDNEVEILKSRTLIKKVVNHLNLYISVAEERMFGYNTPLYKSTPVKVYMTPEEADNLEEGAKLHLKYTMNGKLDVKVEYMLDEEEQETEVSFDSIPAVFPTPVGVFSFTKNDSVPPLEEDMNLVAYVNSPTDVTESYVENLSVEPTSKTTTIAAISLQNTVKQRGIDFINCLVDFYNLDANDEKNEVAQKSAEFIDERIGIINRELGTAETELADFKQRSGLTDLTSDARLALEESSKYEQQLTENATQLRLVESLRNYVNNPKNANEVIPANVGLQDQNLGSIINQYNTMLIERKRLLRTSSENNPAVININTGIESMRHNVQTTVNSVLRGLQIAQSNLERQARKFEGRISSAPQQEKEFLTISRQQEIKATLYIMLLQKREENAITLASTANNGRIIKAALPSKKPVSPKKKIVLLAAFVLGMGIPVGLIYLKDLLKYKIENAEDVEKITDVPILGELPLSKKPEKGAIVVQENQNGMMEEAFRGLRTNMLFMLGASQRVVLFTSTQPGEGKSFIAGNTAVSLAYMGKKVVIVGLDIRKPGLNKVFNLSHRTEGITNYLADPEHTNLFDMIQHSDVSPNLDILPGGPIPPNPTELMARTVLEDAIEKLKERYDYIIFDTAPIAIVTDTAIASRVADMCVYVCRADVTPKLGYQYINVLRDQKKFDKLATVINSIDLNSRKSGYGYGHKYGYGYGHKYGYGYGMDNSKKD